MRKLRVDGRPLNIEPRLPRFLELCRRTPELVAVYLYGSYGTADQTPLSDVDLAFVFQPGYSPSFKQEMGFRSEVLSAFAEDDVSITFLNRTPLPFQFRVLEIGRLLYLADETALANFVEDILKRHTDFRIDYERFLKEYDAALVEKYGRG